MKALLFGEILWDIIEGTPFLGGAPFNVAAHLAQFGVDTYIISGLGKDDLGENAFAEVKKLGVKTDLIQWDEQHPTGTVDVYLEDGQPDYDIHTEVAWDYIRNEPVPADFSTFDCFYFGTLAQRNEVSRKTLHSILESHDFATVFYDVNLRKGIHSKSLIHNSLKYCNVLKLNVQEVLDLGKMLFAENFSNEEFARAIDRQYNIPTTIITAGEDGCFLYQSGALHHVAGKKVQVLDAVGAGDAFSATFLFKLFQQNDPLKAAEAANHLGAFVATSRGAIPPYAPAIKELLNI